MWTHFLRVHRTRASVSSVSVLSTLLLPHSSRLWARASECTVLAAKESKQCSLENERAVGKRKQILLISLALTSVHVPTRKCTKPRQANNRLTLCRYCSQPPLAGTRFPSPQNRKWPLEKRPEHPSDHLCLSLSLFGGRQARPFFSPTALSSLAI